MSDLGTAISARGLVKRFGNFTAVDGIDFEVNRGEVFGFLGPNGSGKTTTIRMMLGLLQPTAGSVKVLDIPVAEKPESMRPRIGYMSQRFSLYNDLTVTQNLNFYGKAYGLEDDLLRARIHEAVEMAGLAGHEHTKTRDLAGGWRQRLALGAAILHRPELIFLDEPTAGVDPVSRRLFWDLLYDLVNEGITIFVTTHYMDEAEHCHRLVFLQRGVIIASGTPEQIKKENTPGQVIEITCDDPERAVNLLKEPELAETLDLREVSLYGSLVHAVAGGAGEKQGEILSLLVQAGIEVEHITQIQPSLEDVFISCMRL